MRVVRRTARSVLHGIGLTVANQCPEEHLTALLDRSRRRVNRCAGDDIAIGSRPAAKTCGVAWRCWLAFQLVTTTNLRTDRLELRPVRDEDIDRILEYRILPEVARWLLRTEVDPTAFQAAWKRAAEDTDDHSVAVALDGVVIGTVSLEVVDGMGQPGMPRRTEAQLGYVFDPAYAGKGYATEAVSAMVAYAFDRLGVRRITAGCFADNLASVRILEKIGMRREQHGIGDSWHAELGWIDGYTYGLLASEWRERTASGPAIITTP